MASVNVRTSRVIATVAVLLVAATMGAAFLSKAFAMADFIAYADQLPGAPGWVRSALPTVLPIVELACACAILGPLARRAGLWATLCLLVGFTVFLVVQLVAGNPDDCHCFGAFLARSSMLNTSKAGIVRNAILITLTVVALRKPSRFSGSLAVTCATLNSKEETAPCV